MIIPQQFFNERRLEKVVENQTSYTLQNAAMHIFETHEQANKVCLEFNQPVLASMLEGKKIMHLENEDSFNFLPGESLILPSNELLCIDFPEATHNNPTRCLAMEIAEEKIEKVILRMNENMTLTDGREWKLLDYNFHFTNDKGIYQILQRLLFLFTENHDSKDFFVDGMLQELIIRILQTNTRKTLKTKTASLKSSNRLAFVIDYIRMHLSRPISIKELSKKACMSESNFHKVFKYETGLTPLEYINTERITLASKLLQNKDVKIKEVFLECGFENRSYFNRVFKRIKKMPPGMYKRNN